MEFYALPVHGDCFLYKTDDLAVLVDGGDGKLNGGKVFTPFFGNQIRHLDLIICTHNDIDHAGGLINIFKNSELTIDELWLPEIWSFKFSEIINSIDIFPELLFKEHSDMLVNDGEFQKHKITEKDLNKDNLYFDMDVFMPTSLSSEVPVLEISLKNKISAIKKSIRLIKKNLQVYPANSFLYFYANLLELFLWAYLKKTKIQFFKHEQPHKKIYLKNKILPMNCVPTCSKNIDISIADYFYLTKVNRESLVFNVLSTRREPSVLLCADSDLSNCIHPDPAESVIITTPHHGSKSNDNTYKIIQNWYVKSNKIWVRSYNSKIKLSLSYIALPKQSKFCIRCNNRNVMQLIKFINFKPCAINFCSCT